MSNIAQLDAICQLFHFSYARSFLEGKIWIFWLDILNLSLREMRAQLVHMEISGPGAISFHILAVHAKCTRVGRSRLWEAMEAVKRPNDPWLVAGDFNVITSASERSGDAPPNARNMEYRRVQ